MVLRAVDRTGHWFLIGPRCARIGYPRPRELCLVGYIGVRLGAEKTKSKSARPQNDDGADQADVYLVGAITVGRAW
jgi:hypothetical protein